MAQVQPISQPVISRRVRTDYLIQAEASNSPLRLRIRDDTPECSSASGYGFTNVTAPSEAEETSAAYFAKTPRL